MYERVTWLYYSRENAKKTSDKWTASKKLSGGIISADYVAQKRR